jgi:hypothetical protein
LPPGGRSRSIRSGVQTFNVGTTTDGTRLVASLLLGRNARGSLYREIAARVGDQEIIDFLTQLAQDYEDVADDLRDGARNLRHPELKQ